MYSFHVILHETKCKCIYLFFLRFELQTF